MLRTASRLLLGLLALLLLLLGIGMLYEQWARWRAPRAVPPPGTLVEVNGRDVHLHCTGAGEPTVILEAGAGSPSAAWMIVQPEIARFARVCSYDRPGLVWSEDDGALPGAVHIADLLHALLAAAGEAPPYVMVGHSLGGPRIMVYADRYPREVVGFVFVDAPTPGFFEELPPELKQTDVELRSQKGTQRLLSFLGATGILRLLNRRAPPEFPDAFFRVMRAFAPQNLRAVFREGEVSDSVLAAAAGAGPFGDLPLVVLAAEDPGAPSRGSSERDRAFREHWVESQREVAALSTNSDFRLIQDVGHFIQLEAPDSVVAAIQDVVDAVRTGARVGT